MVPSRKIIVALSFLLALLVACISLVGIFTPNFYFRETPNWQVQSVGQDIVDLVLIVPALLVTALIKVESKRRGILLWSGVLLYTTYTFTIYTFDIHFNNLFIFYCLAFGLAFNLFLYSIYTTLEEPWALKITRPIVRNVIGTYFITIASLFYLLWLSEVLPASINNTTPKILLEVGLPTNPVHVIDLSIVLPGIFMTGIFLLRNNKLGHVFTPILLIFFLLMDITIGALSFIMKVKGFDGSYILTVVMFLLAGLSIALLNWYMKDNPANNPKKYKSISTALKSFRI